VPKQPRAQQKLDTRVRIRDAAWALFTTIGYDATTTKAVAERAKVATGTVFVHASDKPDLLFLVMHDRLSEVVDAQLEALPRSGPLVDQLLHIFRGLLRMYDEHPDVGKAFIRALPGARGPNAQRVDGLTFSFMHRLAGLVRDAQARGEVAAGIPAEQAAQNFFALYFFALLSWVSGYATAETAVDVGLRAALTLQLRGLRK
jgi:AcrR family transcriptional regulator